MRKGLILALVSAFFFIGCSIPFIGETSGKAPIIEEMKRTPMDKILISELDILDRPYVLIGDVSVSEKSLIPFKSPDKASAELKLREEAFKLKADAVIFVIFSNSEKSWLGTQTIDAYGKAIRFNRY